MTALLAGAGTALGLKSGLTNRDVKESYSVIAVSKMQLFRISRVDFLKRVDAATQQKLSQIWEVQSEWVSSLAQSVVACDFTSPIG